MTAEQGAKPWRRREQVGPATLYLGDQSEILTALQLSNSVAIVSDPPYGIAYQHSGGGKGLSDNRNTKAVAGDDVPFDPAPFLRFDHVIMWGGNHFAARLPHGRWLAWDKLAGVNLNDAFSDVEFAWMKGRGKDRIYSHLWKGLLKASEKGVSRVHPTQKPIALMEWCIGLVPGASVIVDPFMGSGTTGVAALNMGKRFIGCELDEEHFESAFRRMTEAHQQADLVTPQPDEPAPVQQGLAGL